MRFRPPVISAYGSLIVAIQFDLTDELLEQLKSDVASEIERIGPRHLILDISGLEVMDSFVTRGVTDLARVARLMGVRTVISGMRPAVAATLVDMQVSLAGVDCAINLETALERVRRGEETGESDARREAARPRADVGEEP